ncbi:hypothetical protein GBF38_014446 [Nibea albiflora]|uniref:Uncharacterized protein n=1 Tax=Nibea albiflora TaxID=240163 RepID=A0ACB7F7K8_NIBAL|nr:hypothetical protein GBF38_014446 [Nibea albiflora]
MSAVGHKVVQGKKAAHRWMMMLADKNMTMSMDVLMSPGVISDNYPEVLQRSNPLQRKQYRVIRFVCTATQQVMPEAKRVDVGWASWELICWDVSMGTRGSSLTDYQGPHTAVINR